MNREILNQKAWYRATKVIFVIVFLLAQALGFAITSELSNEKVSFVHCDNGKEFQPATLSFDQDKMKLDLFKQCDIVAYFLAKTEIKGVLTDDQHKQIATTILQMESQNALESEIQQTVDNFKLQYAVPNTDHRGYTTEELSKQFGHDFSDTFKVKDSNWVANFTFEYKDKYSLVMKSTYYLLSFFIVSVLFWLISRTFFYIFAKENFLWKQKMD
jgi:hypothetical protein